MRRAIPLLTAVCIMATLTLICSAEAAPAAVL